MKITLLEKNDFEQLFAIMQEAFPPEEYRPKNRQFEILDDENYSVSIVKENGKILGFLAIWNLGEFDFVEHFAIDSTLRNQGIGSSFLKEYLKTTVRPTVLEVENVDDEIPKRRIKFYQRCGLELTDICYNQPNFQNSNKIIPLRIMVFDKTNSLDRHIIAPIIFKKVYKRPIQ